MRFKFKLESLLNHRQFVEDVLQKEFSFLKKRLSEEKQIETHLREKQSHLAEELKINLQASRPVSENSLYVTYLSCLSDQIGRQQGKVEKVESEKSEKKIALMQAVKKRKILERLKDNRVDQYQQFRSQKEQEVSDEIGIQQYNRNTG